MTPTTAAPAAARPMPANPPSFFVLAAIVPALDEVETIGAVVASLRAAGVGRVLVVDNGSRDGTAAAAAESGAVVISEPRRGYGAAVARGLDALEESEIAVFVNGDGSDDVRDLDAVARPVLEGSADLVVGSRVLGEAEPGALSPVQRFGNWLATALLGAIFGAPLTDLGPFRAARVTTLRALEIRDRAFGWTVEMEAKALRAGLRVVEVPVRYRRRRGGRSKISGTILGSVSAGIGILAAVGRAFVDRGVRGGRA